MELKIFTTFETIVRTGSFTKAARILSYTPSTITFHIAQLEKLVGVPLFEKSGRRMILTKAGEALIPYVDEVLSAAKKIKNFQYDIASYQGTLSIGAPESLLCFRLPMLLKRLHAHAPRVDLRLRSLTSRDVVAALRDGQLDIGFAYSIQERDEDTLSLWRFEETPMHFYASMRTAPWCPDLSERGMVIDELPLVTMPHPGEVRQMVDDYLRRQAITFTNLIELRSTQTIINLIRNDMGVALLPDFSVDDLAERGLLRRVLADHLTLTAYYGVHKNKWRSPVMELFLEILAEECGALRREGEAG
ncbi:LysR family transcriptional regulator [Selenomonas sp. oral taxon 892]|uniref:LysR family transcriptional regulator n=1 Tax=Selenomonas sp. oral taxon 892 TaxID=1321785 RepID=UPI00040193DC|nr:LysR family transcriptional regulator [Selenomonas sp. oral taxon 892]